MITGAGRRASHALFGTSIHAADVHCISSAPAIARHGEGQPSAPSAARERRLIASPSRLVVTRRLPAASTAVIVSFSLTDRCLAIARFALAPSLIFSVPALPVARPSSSLVPSFSRLAVALSTVSTTVTVQASEHRP